MTRALAASDATDTGESLVSRAMDIVNQHIREQGLRRGQPIPSEQAFALQMGVSRAVVREAFRSLATVGIIEVGNGRRARVGGIDDTVLPLILNHAVLTDQVSIQQIYDVRRAIELRTVALAALRRTPAEAAEILALTQRMERDFDQPEKVKESDIAFHEAIASASRNPLFALIVSAFRVITEKTWHISWSSRPTDAERHANVLCHRRIAEAIEQQRAREAEALMAEHFDNSVKALLAAGVT
jgi:GntR family transcriptional regulator, transcriptional repressor for pyruvate dehydrogenase complex